MWIECPLHVKHAEYCSTSTVALEGSHCGHAHFTDEDGGNDSWRMVGQFCLVLKPVNLIAVSGPQVLILVPTQGSIAPDLPFGHPHNHKRKRTEYLLLFREGLGWSQESSVGQPSCLLISIPSPSRLMPSAARGASQF